MWEMQQLGRRAGALDIDLMSKQPGKQTSKLLSSLLEVVFEKRWKMFEGRAVQVVLISLLSTDEARGANSIQFECFGFVVTYVATAWCTMICFELCCLIVVEIFFSLPS